MPVLNESIRKKIPLKINLVKSKNKLVFPARDFVHIQDFLNIILKTIKKNISGFNIMNVGNGELIYLDGSHNGEDILSDAIEAFKILKKEGLIFFDDFLQHDKNRALQSYEGIEKFLTLYSNYLKIEYFQNNLVVRKK